MSIAGWRVEQRVGGGCGGPCPLGVSGWLAHPDRAAFRRNAKSAPLAMEGSVAYDIDHFRNINYGPPMV